MRYIAKVSGRRFPSGKLVEAPTGESSYNGVPVWLLPDGKWIIKSAVVELTAQAYAALLQRVDQRNN